MEGGGDKPDPCAGGQHGGDGLCLLRRVLGRGGEEDVLRGHAARKGDVAQHLPLGAAGGPGKLAPGEDEGVGLA